MRKWKYDFLLPSRAESIPLYRIGYCIMYNFKYEETETAWEISSDVNFLNSAAEF